MDPDRDDPGLWQRHGRAILWGIAIALFVIGLLVSLLTPFKVFLLFLPFVFAPTFFRKRDNGSDDDPR